MKHQGIISYGSTDFEEAYSGISRRAAICLFDRLDLMVGAQAAALRDHEQYIYGFVHALYIENVMLFDQYDAIVDLVAEIANEPDRILRQSVLTKFMLNLQKEAKDN